MRQNRDVSFAPMRINIVHLIGLLLGGLGVSASAQDQAFRDGFGASFVASCQKSMHERAVRDFAALAGVQPDKVGSETRTKIQSIAEPVFASCACIRDKVKTTAEGKSSTEIQVSIDMSALLQSPECKPSAEVSASIGQELQRLLQSAPPVSESLKSKRAAFTINASSIGRLSVFASYQPPPKTLPRLVFLAPGTGSACAARDLCIDKDALEMNNAAVVLSKYARVLGQGGSATLSRLIGQFGEDAKIITSSNNFTNFLPTQAAGQFSYAVASMDGQPVERTDAKRVWLVIFSSQIPTDPRALEFTPALTSVLEIVFVDGPQN
jgi:hypothetical protein